MECVRAALAGRLGALCRACLSSPATTDLEAECAVRGAPTLRLRDLLARITYTQIKLDAHTPRGLCDACLADCVHAFTFVTSCVRNAAALQRCLDSVSQHVHQHTTDSSEPLYINIAGSTLTDCDVACEEWGDVGPEAAKYHCSMCALSFTTELLLKRHQRLHAPGTDHICRDCGRIYKNKAILNRHVHAKHRETRIFQCDTCGKTYTSGIGLNNHRASQHAIVRPHIKLELQGDASVGAEIAESDDVRIEESVHEEWSRIPDKIVGPPNGVHARKIQKTSNGYLCEICSKKFQRHSELQRHKRSKHTPLDCPDCGKSFKVRSYYETHVKRHLRTAQERKVHQCEYCAYATDKKFLLTCHTRRRHTHVRPYSCEVCGKGFYIRREVKLHMIVHTRERPETCDVCDKRFVNKTALLFHTRLHTGERPYACAQCGERFLSTSRRGAHVRSKHRPRLQCHMCVSTFTDKQVLKKHIAKKHGSSEAEETGATVDSGSTETGATECKDTTTNNTTAIKTETVTR